MQKIVINFAKIIINLLSEKNRRVILNAGYMNFIISPIIRYLIYLLLSDFEIICGNKVYLDVRRNPEFRLYNIFGYENLSSKIFKENIKKGDVVLDLGANIGYYTLIAAKLVGENCKVYAFEPDPISFSYLKKNVEANDYKNVICEQKAVLDKNEKRKLYLHKFQKGANSIINKYNNHILVDGINLDSYFKNKKQRINFIKMDIEGAEPLALEGMKNILKYNKGIKILSEFNVGILGNKSSMDYLRKIKKLGFNIYEVNNLKEEPKSIKSDDFFSFIEGLKNQKRLVVNIFCRRN